MTKLRRLKLKVEANSKTVSTLKVLALACLLLTIVPATYGQEDTGWQVESVTFEPLRVSFPYQVSFEGSYVAQYYAGLRFSTSNSSESLYDDGHFTRNLPRWLNSTMIFREYRRDGEGEPPECADTELITYGFYNALTSTKEIFCLVPPASYIEQAQGYDTLDRYPFNDHTVLVNNRFLVNVQTNQWQDLHDSFPTNPNITDTLDWIGHGEIWWNSQTQNPMARLERRWQESDSSDDAYEAILFCPVDNDECQTVIWVHDDLHGSLGDMVISPDGQTILWSAFVYPQTEPVREGGLAPIGIVEDTVAFATNLQTGATTEIFRLSDYNTTQANGTVAQWSEDGLTLAIRMLNPTDITESGLLLVQFSR